MSKIVKMHNVYTGNPRRTFAAEFDNGEKRLCTISDDRTRLVFHRKLNDGEYPGLMDEVAPYEYLPIVNNLKELIDRYNASVDQSMTVTLYKNYNVIAHENSPVYTVNAPISEIYDVINVEIPGDLHPYLNTMDAVCIHPDGDRTPSLLMDALFAHKDAPAVRYATGWKILEVTK